MPKNFTKVESNTHIPEHPFKNCRQRALPRTLRKVTLVMEFDGQKPNYVFVVKTRIMIVLKLKGRQFSMQKVNSFVVTTNQSGQNLFLQWTKLCIKKLIEKLLNMTSLEIWSY